ncbi:MAG: MBL fold metallo-hydrolase [Candidatus Brocadiaceae bacterium]|nr:MBL fold metallo-hydrolase [Candidatus Brocadiaceae bacterium]
MRLKNILFETLEVGPLSVNCYILGSKNSNVAIVIDAGGNPEEILKRIKKHNLSLQYIINTHAHFDHVGGVNALQEMTGAQFLIHQNEAPLLDLLDEQATAFGLSSVARPSIDKTIVDNEEIVIGDETIRVIHTPGHSPGSVCFLIDDAVFVGDTLFAGSIGRTDLPGGSHTEIINSIKTRLFTLDDRIIAYPGHGPCTTIGEERQHNPFF